MMLVKTIKNPLCYYATKAERKPAMSDQRDPAGMAALSICEALLLALHDRKLLPEREIVGVLRDAAATHENAQGSKSERQIHKASAKLINEIILGGIPLRRG